MAQQQQFQLMQQRANDLDRALSSNRRVIQQLSGQVDFLNEQLALREAALQEGRGREERAEERDEQRGEEIQDL